MKTPTIFVAHGAPPLLDDPRWMSELNRWAHALPTPTAVLMLSAHWEERPITLGATTTIPLVYDFYGFPRRYYEQQYPAPGAPELARRIHKTLEPLERVVDEPGRGLDHGAYVPLVAMYPKADVPTLQVSLPSLDPTELFSLGRRLAPLRETAEHDVADPVPEPQTPPWASEFDAWAKDALERKDVDALLDYRRRAPGVRLALPTPEHFVPVLVALGAAADDSGAAVKFPIEGFWVGSATRRSVQFG